MKLSMELDSLVANCTSTYVGQFVELFVQKLDSYSQQFSGLLFQAHYWIHFGDHGRAGGQCQGGHQIQKLVTIHFCIETDIACKP